MREIAAELDEQVRMQFLVWLVLFQRDARKLAGKWAEGSGDCRAHCRQRIRCAVCLVRYGQEMKGWWASLAWLSVSADETLCSVMAVLRGGPWGAQSMLAT